MSELSPDTDAAKLLPMRDDPPPFLGKWGNVYRAVLIYLVLMIGVLYAITRAFAV
jgi:hypothetical protein